MIFYLKYLIVIVFGSIVFPQPQEIFFESANPFSFKDIITNIENLETQVVSGILTIPDNASDNIPLVIGVAGSSGWGEHHFEYLKKYQDKLCDELDLIPSDSVWLATTTNKDY